MACVFSRYTPREAITMQRLTTTAGAPSTSSSPPSSPSPSAWSSGPGTSSGTARPVAIPLPTARRCSTGSGSCPPCSARLVIRKPGRRHLHRDRRRADLGAARHSVGAGTVILYGLVQGVGGELAFALTGYRVYRLPVALVGGALAGRRRGAPRPHRSTTAPGRTGYQVAPTPASRFSAPRSSPGAGGWAAATRAGPDRRAGPVRRPAGSARLSSVVSRLGRDP